MTRASILGAVFLTTELLEKILQYLPMKDLLLAQRVSRKWRAVINESRALQQALFLLPREADAYWELIEGPKDKLVRIPKDDYVRGVESKDVFRSGRLNQLLFEEIQYPYQGLVSRAEDGGCEVFRLRFRPSAKHAAASWRRMLVTQPPAYELFTHYSYVKLGLVCEDDPFSTGVTAGNAMERMEKAESDGDQFEWERHFLSTANILFPNEEEAKMKSISR